MQSLRENILKILHILEREKYLDTFMLAGKISLTRGEVEKLIGFMLSHGYVKIITADSTCNRCLLKNVCPVSKGRDIITVYTITGKGRALLGSR